jgi:hypothetical protein
MNRPEVRQIEVQKIESEKEITGWEAEQILRKYGHQTSSYNTNQVVPEQTDNSLTFEQMIELEEQKKKNEIERKKSLLHGSKPKTFDGSNGYSSDIKYGTDEDTGFNFKIEINTDMNLPKY